MKASDAKQAALDNKKKLDETHQIRKDDRQRNDVATLLSHFHTSIQEAVNKGNLSTPEIQFPVDRFTDEVVREVATKLRDDGYNLVQNKHNAFQMTKFQISWS